LSAQYRKIYKEHQDDIIDYVNGVSKIYIDFVEQNPHKSMFLIHLLSNRNDPSFYPIFKDFMEKNIKSVEKVLTISFPASLSPGLQPGGVSRWVANPP